MTHRRFCTFFNILICLIVLPYAYQKPARRCGMAPATQESGRKWSKNDLTFKIYNWTEPFTKASIRSVFEDAIKKWTKNVNLRITETESNSADILIHFSEQDGISEVLGYAYFPENGDIYFDQDEDWTLESSATFGRTYFGWVAIHELGHALGLPHSESRSSIMFPYYSAKTTKPTSTDLRALRSRYGEAKPDNSLLCDGGGIDAILDTIIIKGHQYWTLSNGALESGPFSLDELYNGLPEKIDAAFEVGGKKFFLSGSRYYKFEPNTKNGQRRFIYSGFDHAPSNIDAAFYDRSSTVYFFKGSKYYALETKGTVGMRLMVNGESTAKDWGISDKIEGVTMVDDDEVLFFTKIKCYVVSLGSKNVISKRDCSEYLKCN